jgi:hypothetical protein
MNDNIQITVERDAEGKPFVSFKSPLGVDAIATKYRRFHDIAEFLTFAGIKTAVFEHVTSKLRNVPPPSCEINIDEEQSKDQQSSENIVNRNYSKVYAKVRNEAIWKYTRVPQKQFMKLVNGKMYEAFVKTIPEPLRMKLCYGRNGFSTLKVNKVLSTLPILEQAHVDKQTHLMPFLMSSRRTPQELKVILGKGLWKKLCANTYSRNRALAESSSIDYWQHNDMQHGDFKREIGFLNTVPTSLLKYTSYSHGTLDWLRVNCKGIWNKPADLKRQADIFRDTARMLSAETATQSESDLQVKMINWSCKRVQEEHDLATKRTFARRYSKDQYNWSNHVHIGPFSFEGYLVTPLFNSYDIAQEGQAMQHCVGSYAYQSQRGDYIVFSVTKDGERHSTIGMFMTLELANYYQREPIPSFFLEANQDISAMKVEVKTKAIVLKVEFQQQYKKFNRLLDPDDKAHAIPSFIERMINT